MGKKHTLTGIKAYNPLGFLAGLGTLSTLHRIDDIESKMSWRQIGSHWSPCLHLSKDLDRDALAEALNEELSNDLETIRYTMTLDGEPKDALSKVSFSEFRLICQCLVPGTLDELAIASYGTDLESRGPGGGEVPRTALALLDEGAGHDGFLEAQRNIVKETTVDKLKEALFQDWRYRDNGSGKRTMRWSPVDGRRGAYTGTDPTNMAKKTVHAANRLAIEATRLLSVLPRQGGGAATTAVVKIEGDQFLQYPLWSTPVTAQTARALLTHPELASTDPSPGDVPGVEKVLRSKIENIGGYRNLAQAVPVR